MKRQGGFTLIELVVVIVILGILAVTAAPRFLNLQDDAREASLDGLSGAIKGAVGIVYGKAAIQGVESSTTAIGVALDNNVNVSTKFGYPVATAAELVKVVDGIGASASNEDFVQIQTGGAESSNDQWITFGIASYTGRCVKYTMANGSAPAVVEVTETTTECTAPVTGG
ncbi:type II secretion system protein [Vibrio sp. FJH11]